MSKLSSAQLAYNQLCAPFIFGYRSRLHFCADLPDSNKLSALDPWTNEGSITNHEYLRQTCQGSFFFVPECRENFEVKINNTETSETIKIGKMCQFPIVTATWKKNFMIYDSRGDVGKVASINITRKQILRLRQGRLCWLLSYRKQN